MIYGNPNRWLYQGRVIKYISYMNMRLDNAPELINMSIHNISNLSLINEALLYIFLNIFTPKTWPISIKIMENDTRAWDIELPIKKKRPTESKWYENCDNIQPSLSVLFGEIGMCDRIKKAV